MTERHDRDPGTSRRGGTLLAAVLSVAVLVSASVYSGVPGGPDEDGPRSVQGGAGSGKAAGNPARGSARADSASAGGWAATWATAPVGAEPRTGPDGWADRSLRNVVHTSVGGTGARVTLSNLYGTAPLHITHASLAVAAAPGSAAAEPGTPRRLLFAGRPSVVVAPGAQIVSDAVALRVPADADMLISTYTPTPSGPVTYHPRARQVSYVAPGDRAGSVSGAGYARSAQVWRYVTALDVRGGGAEGTVVAFGDSLTDGVTATVGADRRWPDVLADRLAERRDGPRYGVANLGISGNRLLSDGAGRPPGNPSGWSRFERDVLDRTGARVAVVALGINDILRTPHVTDPRHITEGLRDLTRRAHARGLRVVGATLMPFHGHRGYRPALEQVRQAVNADIRSGTVFDMVADFDRALRDPRHPRALHPHYDSGDHLHPSDAGYARMAEAADLTALRGHAPAEL